MATDLAAQLAAQALDPAMAKMLGQKYWNHFAIQLGHWNSMKVIIMDDEMFRIIPFTVKIELAREMTKFLNEDVMFARDADNFKVWILGPKKIIRPNVTIVDTVPIWDPKKKHLPPPEIKIPRPPNAYILYRKDKHTEVKAENPNLHNNEISVITGAMWKGETPEVRAKYHQKAHEIKAQILALYPTYRYAPRKSSEIRRRARRATDAEAPPIPPIQPYFSPTGSPPRAQAFEHNAHHSAQFNNGKADLRPNSDITKRMPGAQRFLPPVVEPGWTPYHLNSPTEPALAEAPAEEAEANHDLDMNGGQDFSATLEELIDNWDIEADLARMAGEI
ncbi:mat a-1 [Parachaetomium inaequale]|uniref:Mat a-1 n=1 Tax=Parachaetomium inaequale TaxID=2588326 RepID=A0AAN6PGR7_9PEZI|nr:mat a-1 [Parachaetomium inaequale]